MLLHKFGLAVITAILLLSVTAGAWPAPGYFAGSYYAAHVIREGGELVRNEDMHNGYRWEDYSISRIKGNRIPAKIGHGLEVFADIYGMPAGEPVTLKVTRPVRTVTGTPETRSYQRSQLLAESGTDHVQVFAYIYFLDEPDELVPGEWIIELSYRDTLILRETFEVYPDAS